MSLPPPPGPPPPGHGPISPPPAWAPPPPPPAPERKQALSRLAMAALVAAGSGFVLQLSYKSYKRFGG